ncbi:unannotated protein [freshwater metagenome]|uniref:Unannotated protein n=1 Tax=freshwater metagenome TaxID=449393 RepID=A0A6J6JPT3_9ZZZZ
MLVTDLADSLKIAGGWWKATARVLDWLQEDSGHSFGALEFDQLFNAVRCPETKLFFCAAGETHFLGTVVVGVGHPEATGCEGLKHFLHRRDSGDGESALRRPVVGDVSRDHFVLHGLTHELPVLLGQLESALDGFATSRGEEHLVQIPRGIVSQFVCKLDGGRVSVGPEREEREFFSLLGSDLGKTLATVPCVDRKEACEAIKIPLAFVVPDVVAGALHNDGHLGTSGEGPLPGEVHPEMIASLVLQGLGLLSTALSDRRRLCHVLLALCGFQ